MIEKLNDSRRRITGRCSMHSVCPLPRLLLSLDASEPTDTAVRRGWRLSIAGWRRDHTARLPRPTDQPSATDLVKDCPLTNLGTLVSMNDEPALIQLLVLCVIARYGSMAHWCRPATECHWCHAVVAYVTFVLAGTTFKIIQGHQKLYASAVNQSNQSINQSISYNKLHSAICGRRIRGA